MKDESYQRLHGDVFRCTIANSHPARRTTLTVRASVLRVWFALARAHRLCHCHCHCVGPRAARRGARVGPRNACGVRASEAERARRESDGEVTRWKNARGKVGRPIGDKSASHLAISSQTQRKCSLLPSKCRRRHHHPKLPAPSYVVVSWELASNMTARVWLPGDCCRVSAARWRGAGGCAASRFGRKPLRDFFASARRCVRRPVEATGCPLRVQRVCGRVCSD
jgi:hypothetical protein